MKFKTITGALIAASAFTLALASCGGKDNKKTTPTTPTTPAISTTDPVTTTTSQEVELMTYAQYNAATDGTKVKIQGYVQGKQSWWSNKATIYMQDDNGGYFVYELGCSQDDYNTKLTVGAHIEIEGVKGSWAGQQEVLGSQAGDEATWKVVDSATKTYEAEEIKFNEVAMTANINKKVKFVELEVVKVEAPTSEGGDIYYDVKKGDLTLTFCVESYLCDKTTDVYKTVLALQVGDIINVEGFMYTYNKPQLHTTACSVLK